MIIAKIDVTKIDKSKLFAGAKGKYLDVVLIETPQSQYGDDYMVVQGVSKEDREKGIKGAILGNAKILGQKPVQQQAAAPSPTPAPAPQNRTEQIDFEDVPF